MIDLWNAAECAERDVFDMFVIRFLGPPDSRRILMWKDYPAESPAQGLALRGRVDREYYQRAARTNGTTDAGILRKIFVRAVL